MASADPAPPAFLPDSPTSSTSGTIQLNWNSDEPNLTHEIEHSPPGTEAYLLRTGSDTTTVISGMNEGTHRFRVRSFDGETSSPWSTPITIENHYISRSKVNLLLILGGIVVLATIAAIVTSHIQFKQTPDS